MKQSKTYQSRQHILAKICPILLFIITFSFKISAQQKMFVVNNRANPLKKFSIALNKESHPFFVDIDRDGDLDCFSGEYANGQLSKIYFYRNDGTTKTPLFKQITGINNPLNQVGANTLTIPYFIDIDADGDYDCFIGEGTTGAIMYYKNTGTARQPQFEKQSAAYNSLSMVKLLASGVANPAFGDIDRDGDYDCLIVDEEGNEYFFKNEGTREKPVFVHVINSDDPFKSLTIIDGMCNTSFEDWDHDGLIDLFINTTYYKNIGTKTKPEFIAGNDKPIFSNKSGDKFVYTPLRWVDLNGDGSVEVFQGNSNGSFIYQTLSSTDNAVAQSPERFAFVSPNPSKEAFTLHIPGAINAASVMRVSDVQGKLLIVQSLNSNSVKFGTELKEGAYFVEVLQNDKVICTKKIIKE
jgi:hypothetical protein